VDITETVKQPPTRFESARILETAIALLWRNTATCLGLLLCLATLWTAFFYSLFSFATAAVPGPSWRRGDGPLSLAILATLVSAPFLLHPALVDVYLHDLKNERATFLNCLRTTAFEAVPTLALGLVPLLGSLLLPSLLILAPTTLFSTLVNALQNSDPLLVTVLLCALLFAFLSVFATITLFCALFVAIPARRLEQGGIFAIRQYRQKFSPDQRPPL